MAYLTRVGGNVNNKSGIECRGYHVYRRGSRVRVVWGPIHFPRAQSVSVEWSRATVYIEYRRSSPAAAAALLKRIVGEQLDAGYQLLPIGCKITPALFARGMTKRVT
jgi:hypothetical protein